MRVEMLALGGTLAVLMVTVAMWLMARRIRHGAWTLTRLTHLAPDAQSGWLHVLGAQRTLPEYGDGVDRWVHVLVEPRTGQWHVGGRSVGGDPDFSAAMVTQSLATLQATLGWRPQPTQGGKLHVLVRKPDDVAGAEPTTGLVVAVGPRLREPPTQPCVATLVVDGHPRGTHTFEALADARFFGRILQEARVVVFTYVGAHLGDPQAHLVAFDLDTGTVLFDRVCTIPTA